MSTDSSMLLLGVGTAGAAVARGVSRAFGDGLRYALADTDAKTGEAGGPFTLLGGDRLSGRGTGGDIVLGRKAAEDSSAALDAALEGVRLAVVATCLGGGTGGGATLVTLQRLAAHGIPSIVFATTPFACEGPDRQRNARGMMTMIEEAAGATVFLPLDDLVAGEDNFENALRRAVDTLATGITLFWRLVEKPGYLRLDAERIRHLVTAAGRGRFATVSVQGANRAADAVDALARAPLLANGSGAVRSILCGVLAGEDLRLSELSTIANGLRGAFGEHCAFELATVNDEQTFCGRLCVVALLFESGGAGPAVDAPDGGRPSARRGKKARSSALETGPVGRGRFNNAEPTVWHDEDLDVPTFIRQNINLDV